MKYQTVLFVGGQEDGKWSSVLAGVPCVHVPRIHDVIAFTDDGKDVRDVVEPFLIYKRVPGVDFDTYVLEESS
ncbi:hypothetical protein ACOAOW_11490 [Pseudomonas aeruginosa]|uniref:hypothetical protein n=1 Tax=Pseudomonas aeruginosa TaxID=287 RepID=UPI000F52AB87|nr:hypothetical protein [Pseudomonas aeruginosa]MBI8300317.1 hypothetical protein [Pseudomonas aeruginosa]MCS8330346.1 hypothetical protein [Pseudomonas aeruginosa]MCS8784207.1 hypothetical protein [Pseudomonas aeruginosa]MCT5734055.1 hypothetical protein [Pseudomonas aeruginosa]MCT5924332.1 hypothetical protein [Pseudomonas aeruginosa]